MEIIGRLSDAAQLVIGGQDFGRAVFDIVVFQANGLPHGGRGKLSCDFNLLYRALNGGDPQLVLNTGETLRFSVVEISSDGAEIEVRGDVLGF